MSADPVRPLGSAFDPTDAERLTRFLRAERAPLALIEVTSAAQATALLQRLIGEHGSAIAVWRRDATQPAQQALDWALVRNSHPGTRLMVPDLGAQGASSRRAFWEWANAQRERWPPERGSLAFVLTPGEVDDLVRFAPALWDWVALKFDLRAPLDTLAEPTPVVASEQPGEAHLLALLPSLKAGLLTARQSGLPASVVRRDYAWPLFRALVTLELHTEAEHLLATELTGALEHEIPAGERALWWWLRARLALARRDDEALRPLIGRALDALDASPQPELRALAHAALADSWERSGQAEPAEAARAQAWEWAERSSNPNTLAAVALGMGDRELRWGHHDEARACLGRAARAVRNNVVLSAHIDARQGQLAWREGRGDEARRHLATALAAFRNARETRAAAWVLEQLGHIAVATGQGESAAQHFSEAAELWQALPGEHTARVESLRARAASMAQGS